MKLTKRRWNFIKFFGYRYRFIEPNIEIKEYILYKKRYYDLKKWNDFFKENKIYREKGNKKNENI